MVKYILDSRFWCVEEEDNYFKADLGHSNEALSQTWKGQDKAFKSGFSKDPYVNGQRACAAVLTGIP